MRIAVEMKLNLEGQPSIDSIKSLKMELLSFEVGFAEAFLANQWTFSKISGMARTLMSKFWRWEIFRHLSVYSDRRHSASSPFSALSDLSLLLKRLV